MTDFNFSEFLRLYSFVKYFHLVFKDPKYRIVYLFLEAIFSPHRLFLSLDVPFKMVFSNLILRRKAPSMKNMNSFLRSELSFFPDVHGQFQDVSTLRAIYSQKFLWSSANPRGKRRLMLCVIPSIRLEERFVTMMNVLVSNLEKTYTLGYVCAVWQWWLRKHSGPPGGAARPAACLVM